MPTDEEIIAQGVGKLVDILREQRVVILPDYESVKEYCKKQYGISKDSAFHYIWEFCERLLDKGTL